MSSKFAIILDGFDEKIGYFLIESKLFTKVGKKNKISKNKIKISKPSDPTIATQFNTYSFADYKEQVIELLEKVCRVGV